MAFMSKAKYVHSNLPEWMRFTEKHSESREIFDFLENDSVLEILPATSKAGRSTDATFVIRDELATHPNAKANFTAIYPTVSGGAQLIDLSTIDQLDTESHFTERVERAMKGASRKDLPSGLNVFYGGESGAVLVFGGWELRPERIKGLSNQEWFDREIVPKMTPQDVRQEYPATIEEALDMPEQTRYYSNTALNDMLYQIMPSIRCDDIDTRNGIIEIYKPAVVGEMYCGYLDPSDGKEDPFHMVFLNTRTGEGVCEATGMLPVDEVAKLFDELIRYYNAFNTFEVNGVGYAVWTILKTLNTPNQAPRRSIEGTPVNIGGEENTGQYVSSQMRDSVLKDLEIPIRKRLIVSHRRETIEQLRTLVRVKLDGRMNSKSSTYNQTRYVLRVPKGKHDDAIMAWAGVWRLQKYAPSFQGVGAVVSVKFNQSR